MSLVHPHCELRWERAYLVVTIERDELLTRDQAEEIAKLALHQGARVAVVPASEVLTLDEG